MKKKLEFNTNKYSNFINRQTEFKVLLKIPKLMEGMFAINHKILQHD